MPRLQISTRTIGWSRIETEITFPTVMISTTRVHDPDTGNLMKAREKLFNRQYRFRLFFISEPAYNYFGYNADTKRDLCGIRRSRRTEATDFFPYHLGNTTACRLAVFWYCLVSSYMLGRSVRSGRKSALIKDGANRA